ncbi:MAG: glycosyltransferase family 9 protein, partial [Candidatus Omnitrophica bacterium]|nr:glycosyltransferase family 9 protein [Candidatus Omnitrophota bacterium]
RKRLTEFGMTSPNKLYLLAPGGGRIPLREWPLEHFVSLAKRIHADPDAWILVIGLNDPADRGATLVNALPSRERSLNLIGKTDLSELLTLFTMSQALVVNDSGLGHLAALTSIKHHVLFGPEHPSIFSPCGKETVIYYKGLPCSPCLSVFNHRNSACRDNLCLKAISVDEVFDAVRDK